MTDDELLENAKTTAEFIAKIFADNVEVVVHDVRDDLNHSVIAVYNSYISGRDAGAPMTQLGRKFIDEKTYRHCDFVCNYDGVTDNGVAVRASTLFVKNKRGRVIGFICVNVDVTRYGQAIKMLQDLLNHGRTEEIPSGNGRSRVSEEFPRSHTDRLEQAMLDYCRDTGKRTDILTSDDKYAIVARLENEGLFIIKGAIGEAAAALRLSEPTLYRYLKKIRREKRM